MLLKVETSDDITSDLLGTKYKWKELSQMIINKNWICHFKISKTKER